MLDAHKIKKDFPIFRQKFSGQPLVYLDSTASSQKPQAVIDAVSECYEKYYANVHRGIYQLSELASDAYEASRATVAKFIGATIREIIFTRNATESLNLIAFTWGKQNIAEGDEIIITEMEHVFNFNDFIHSSFYFGYLLVSYDYSITSYDCYDTCGV